MNTVLFTTLAKVSFWSSKIAFTFCSTRSVCTLMSPATRLPSAASAAVAAAAAAAAAEEEEEEEEEAEALVLAMLAQPWPAGW